jgi:hypothetical protein
MPSLVSFGDDEIIRVTEGKEDIMSAISMKLFRGVALSAAFLSTVAISTVSQAEDRPVPPNAQVSALTGAASAPTVAAPRAALRSPVATPAARHTPQTRGWVDAATVSTNAAQGDLISNAGTGP